MTYQGVDEHTAIERATFGRVATCRLEGPGVTIGLVATSSGGLKPMGDLALHSEAGGKLRLRTTTCDWGSHRVGDRLAVDEALTR